MKKEREKVNIIVEYTDGFSQRFTEELMKIYQKRKNKSKKIKTSA